jgi:hypothetical protein
MHLLLLNESAYMFVCAQNSRHHQYGADHIEIYVKSLKNDFIVI